LITIFTIQEFPALDRLWGLAIKINNDICSLQITGAGNMQGRESGDKVGWNHYKNKSCISKNLEQFSIYFLAHLVIKANGN